MSGAAPDMRDQVKHQISRLPQGLQAEAQSLLDHVPDPLLEEVKRAVEDAPTLNDAYRRLGDAGGPGATGGDPEEDGELIFQRLKAQILRVLCGTRAVRAYCQNASVMDLTTVSALVTGALVTQLQTAGVNLALVVCVVVRAGLRELCGQTWITTKG